MGLGVPIGRGAISAYRGGVRLRAKAFSLLCGGGFAEFGRSSVIQPPVRLRGERRIAVGDGVFVGAGSWLQVLGEPKGDVALRIGTDASIAGMCVLSAWSSIELGRGVLLARNVYIADHMHAFEKIDQPVLAQGVERLAPISIGDGAWLGQNVVVGPGVTIGRGAVIGANSVVLDSIPDHVVAIGAPARAVRSFARQATA